MLPLSHRPVLADIDGYRGITRSRAAFPALAKPPILTLVTPFPLHSPLVLRAISLPHI